MVLPFVTGRTGFGGRGGDGARQGADRLIDRMQGQTDAMVLGRGRRMQQYSPEDFSRHGQHVRSPVSTRRQRRLVRLALACGLVTAGGVALLALALAG
jgi:hypothetical protein